MYHILAILSDIGNVLSLLLVILYRIVERYVWKWYKYYIFSFITVGSFGFCSFWELLEDFGRSEFELAFELAVR